MSIFGPQGLGPIAPRLTGILAWCLVTAVSVAQPDPASDLCRIWGQQTALVDSKLYIEGGIVTYTPKTTDMSNDFFLYSDPDTEPHLHTNLSKNTAVSDVNGGILWEDSVNKRLFLYGGEHLHGSPPNSTFYSYDILYNSWAPWAPVDSSDTGAVLSGRSYGAGVSISSRGEAYYYGGWISNASVPVWSGPQAATDRMLKYNMDNNSWSNITGPDTVRRSEGIMVFIPISDAGMLIYFGGVRDLSGNGTITPQSLDTIYMYDLAKGKWYIQKTSGSTPQNRRRFCGGATWAQDQSSYNIYIYGGQSFSPNTTGYDDIYILTIPSFQWIRAPYQPGSNISGHPSHPKSMMSCEVIDNSQMIVFGGNYTNDTASCDPSVLGKAPYVMQLGELKDNGSIWDFYQPNLTTYAVPSYITTAVGGGATGGATKTAPASGFDTKDLAALMTRRASSTTRAPTRQVSNLSTTSPTAAPSTTQATAPVAPKTALTTGQITGIAVSATVLVAALAGCGGMLAHRRRGRSGQPSGKVESSSSRAPAEAGAGAAAGAMMAGAAGAGMAGEKAGELPPPQGDPPNAPLPPDPQGGSHSYTPTGFGAADTQQQQQQQHQHQHQQQHDDGGQQHRGMSLGSDESTLLAKPSTEWPGVAPAAAAPGPGDFADPPMGESPIHHGSPASVSDYDREESAPGDPDPDRDRDVEDGGLKDAGSEDLGYLQYWAQRGQDYADSD